MVRMVAAVAAWCAVVASSLEMSRRGVLRRTLVAAPAAATAPLLALPSTGLAKESLPTPDELKKLTVGYARIQELLTDWEGITTGVCTQGKQTQVVSTNGQGCAKSPLKVQEYIGFKSINDPLFRADKLMMRAAPLVKDQDSLEDYFDAVRLWSEKVQMSSLMAYTSSWGEANPNGGAGQIALFLEDARYDVEDSARLLRKIIDYLDLPVA